MARNLHLICIGVFLGYFGTPDSHAEVRAFIDSSGQVIQGELVAVEDNYVTIQRQDGQLLKAKASSFSPNDNAYFRSRTQKPGESISVVAANSGKARSLLDKTYEPRWKIVRGDWKRGDGSLTGEGDSLIEYQEHLHPPFTLQFKINILKGMRPRVRLGPIGCLNEGYQTTLALYPPGRDAGLFQYERNKVYKISLVATRDQVEFYVDDKLISKGPGITTDLSKLEFRAGDGWSKGTVEYRDIVLLAD